jgi:magnesium chelatase subunit I
MIGEVEVMRSIINKVMTIPRFSDIYCIFQSSKFELDEIEDTTENKIKFLNNTIYEIMKETSIDYFTKLINSEEIISIKNEFKGKTFTVLQNQYQQHQHQQQQKQINNRNNQQLLKSDSKKNSVSNNITTTSNNNSSLLYSEQLKQFSFTKKIVKKIIDEIREEQTEYINKAQKNNISNNLEYLEYNNMNNKNKILDEGEFDKHEELIASIMELLLEYLRFSNPPILDRKENKFEYTGI